MKDLLVSVLPTLILLGLFVLAVYLVKYLASRFWDFK